jgi:hypothetical protein
VRSARLEAKSQSLPRFTFLLAPTLTLHDFCTNYNNLDSSLQLNISMYSECTVDRSMKLNY